MKKTSKSKIKSTRRKKSKLVRRSKSDVRKRTSKKKSYFAGPVIGGVSVGIILLLSFLFIYSRFNLEENITKENIINGIDLLENYDINKDKIDKIKEIFIKHINNDDAMSILKQIIPLIKQKLDENKQLDEDGQLKEIEKMITDILKDLEDRRENRETVKVGITVIS